MDTLKTITFLAGADVPADWYTVIPGWGGLTGVTFKFLQTCDVAIKHGRYFIAPHYPGNDWQMFFAATTGRAKISFAGHVSLVSVQDAIDTYERALLEQATSDGSQVC